MHNPSISILGPGPDVMLIEGFDCIPELSRYWTRCVQNLNVFSFAHGVYPLRHKADPEDHGHHHFLIHEYEITVMRGGYIMPTDHYSTLVSSVDTLPSQGARPMLHYSSHS